MRLTSALLFVLSACILSVVGYVLLVASPRYSIYVLVGDDAGYYFAVARNFCLGHGLTFDRLHETNGFNPLLTALLIGTYKSFVPGLSLLGCYRAGILLTLLANLASLTLMLRLVGGFMDPQVFAGSVRRLVFASTATFFIGFITLKSNYGMDAPLVLLVGLTYLLRVRRRGLVAPGVGAALIDGALLGLLFLARVDSLPLLVTAFALMIVLALRDRTVWGGIVGRSLVTMALVMPYLMWSERHFGTWLPVSARLKSRFPDIDVPASMHVMLHSSLNPADLGSFVLAFAVALGTAAWFLRGLRQRRPADTLADPQLAAIALVTFFLLMRFSYMAMFSRLDVQGSYAILAHPYNVVMAMVLTSAWARRNPNANALGRRRIAQLACGLLLLVSAMLVTGKCRVLLHHWGAIEAGGRGDELALARAIHEKTRPGDVIYGGAFGLVGFFADRAWINGDGVANNYAYQDVLENDGLEGYLAENRVTHAVYLLTPGMVSADGRVPLLMRSELNGRVNHYSVADTATVLVWRSNRNRGATVCLARYSGDKR
ncbi:MAG: hypothetical protein ABIU54_05000 [Candidatus Eisenbacteria bacterium]